MRIIAGLETVSGGEIRIGDKRVNELPPADRKIAMVFQSYALYPHMNVYKNMAFGLKFAKTDKAEVDRRVRQAAEILKLTPLLHRKPRELSGGQRQRVAIGRAIVREPERLPVRRAALESRRGACASTRGSRSPSCTGISARR